MVECLDVFWKCLHAFADGDGGGVAAEFDIGQNRL